jgi:hypothetical protein
LEEIVDELEDLPEYEYDNLKVIDKFDFHNQTTYFNKNNFKIEDPIINNNRSEFSTKLKNF